jgi:chaperonin GroEL
MPKDILQNQESRNALFRGIDELGDAARSQIGPTGHKLISNKKFGALPMAKDGLIVVKDIDLKDPYETLGAKWVCEVANKTWHSAHDGTATATVLAQTILREGTKAIEGGADPERLKSGIDKAVELVLQKIKELALPVKDEAILHVGTTSANGDFQIGSLIAEAIGKVGKYGVIDVRPSGTPSTSLEFREGMQFDCGYLSPYFNTNLDRMEATLESPAVLIYENKIDSLKPLLPLLEQLAKQQKSLLIIAEDIQGEALATLIVNKLRGTVKVAAVKAAALGRQKEAILKNIAELTGGTVIREHKGITLENVSINQLGSANRIVIDHDHTTIVTNATIAADVGSPGRRFGARMPRGSSASRHEKLTAGVAVINVGATTDVELKEKIALVEDATIATKAAMEEGVVPGGGVALLRARQALSILDIGNEDEMTGVEIVKTALSEPLFQIAENAGFDGTSVVEKVLAGNNVNFGFNAINGKIEDLVVAGVVDGAKVTSSALQNAADIAGMILTTDPLTLDPAAASAHNAQPQQTFYFLLDGEHAKGNIVEYGTDVDLVFNYGELTKEALANVKGKRIRRALETGEGFGISVIPRGFTFRNEDGWYKTGRFENGKLTKPVRFLLRANLAEDHDQSDADGEIHDLDTGFLITFHFKGSAQYAFSIPVHLTHSLADEKEPGEAAVTFEIDLDKHLKDAAIAEALLSNALEVRLL